MDDPTMTETAATVERLRQAGDLASAAKAAIEAEQQLRGAECWRRIEEVLAEFRCRLEPEILVTANGIYPRQRVIPLE